MPAIDPEQGARAAGAYSLASEIVELVVVTRDPQFLQTWRATAGQARRIWHVPTADKAADLLVAGDVGILVLDVAAVAGDASAFMAGIKQQFPDLIVVLAGGRDAEHTLAPLVSDGTAYRFIHKPISPERARSFADAAVRRYGERRNAAPAGPQRPARAWIAWLAAIAAAAMAAAIALGDR